MIALITSMTGQDGAQLAKFLLDCGLRGAWSFAPKRVGGHQRERQILNIRMGNRCMTRLTNAFSKKAANHADMIAIVFMHYNLVRIYQTLKRW